VIGTPAFMSPEQAAGRLEDVGVPSDVYSLGATLYYVLCGAPPYAKRDIGELLRQVARGEFQPPRQVKPAVPPAMQAICLRAMSLDPAARYASPAALADDVERFLADERVHAWPEPWHVGLRRAVRRRRTLAAVLLALAVVIPIATGVGSWLVARERGQAEILRRTAQIKDETAAEMTDYLRRLFATADPIGLDDPGFRSAKSEETTRRLLDSGALLVREHLGDQPLPRAELLDAMGNAYRNLGDWEQAEALLTEGFELRRAHLGAEEAKTIDSLHSLARLNHDRGTYVEAERLYRQVADWRARRHGPDHLLTAQVKFYQAWMTFHRPLEGPVFDEAQLREAERLLREVLAVRERELPENHTDIAFTLAALAAVKASQVKQEQEAALLVARALEIFRQSETNSEVGILVLVYINAEAARKAGRFDDALVGYHQVMEHSKKYLGPRHPLVLIQVGNLVGTYRAKGDLDTAIRLGYEALEWGRELPLRSAPGMVKVLREFADMVRPRDPNAATELYAEALKYARERPADNADQIAALEALLAELNKAKAPP
jgi:tetratricopeptide (TPR) repeat protein